MRTGDPKLRMSGIGFIPLLGVGNTQRAGCASWRKAYGRGGADGLALWCFAVVYWCPVERSHSTEQRQV